LVFRTGPTSGHTRSLSPSSGFGLFLCSFLLPLLLVQTASLLACGRILIDSESPWWLVRSGKLKEAETSLRRLSRKNDTADPAKTVAMMVRTNQHELENQPGVSYFDCFKGSDLRRTEIAVIGWAVQVLSGSSFGNQGTYFFQQGGSSLHSGVLTRAHTD
jgi:SP family general alpha glucoside:H+ symporter-like MFS transporter